MPYIKQENRDEYDEYLDGHIEDLKEHGFPKGDVTYCVYKMVGHWFLSDPGYDAIADIRGMLAGVLSEFDRRLAFPYEDKKIEENGDVDFTRPMIEGLPENWCGFDDCLQCSPNDQGDA